MYRAAGTNKTMEKGTIIHAGDRFIKNAAVKTEDKHAAVDNLLTLIAKPETHADAPELLPLEQAMNALVYHEFTALFKNRIAQQIFAAAENMTETMHMNFSNWKLVEESLDDFLNNDAWESFGEEDEEAEDEEDERVFLWDKPYLQFVRKTKSATYTLKIYVTSIQLDFDEWTPEQIIFYTPENGDIDPLSEMITLEKEFIKTDKENNRWFYDMDTNAWAPYKESEWGKEFEIIPPMDQEDWEFSDNLNDIILDAMENDEYDKEPIKMYTRLHEMTTPYMQCDEIEAEEKRLLALTPADWKNCGYAVCLEQNGAVVLCQYLDSATAIPTDQSKFDKNELKSVMDPERPEQTDDLYLKGVAITKDAEQMAAWLKCLANRYLPSAAYLVPLSDQTYVIAESVEDLLKNPKIEHFDDEVQQDALTKEEEQALKDAYNGFMRALACSRLDALYLTNE